MKKKKIQQLIILIKNNKKLFIYKMDTNKIIKGYKILQRIGKGGCGAVYLAQKENKNYAIKKIYEPNKDEIEYYQKILNALYKIRSEYVIKIMNHL